MVWGFNLPLNSISVISGLWKDEHEELHVMKRCSVRKESRLQWDSYPRPVNSSATRAIEQVGKLREHS